MPPIPAPPNSWNERRLLVLQSAVARFDAGEDVHGTHIAADTGVAQFVGDRTARELREMGWLDARFISEDSWVEGLSERARRLVGAWPSAEALTDRLLGALEQAVADAPDDEERTRRGKVLDGVRDGVLVNASGTALGTAAIGD